MLQKKQKKYMRQMKLKDMLNIYCSWWVEHACAKSRQKDMKRPRVTFTRQKIQMKHMGTKYS